MNPKFLIFYRQLQYHTVHVLPERSYHGRKDDDAVSLLLLCYDLLGVGLWALILDKFIFVFKLVRK